MKDVVSGERVEAMACESETAGKQRGKRLGGVTGRGFQPGVSGNPNGRPRTAKFSEACRRLAEEAGPLGLTGAEELAQYCYGRALRGSVRHAELFLNYCEGKPKQAHEISGPDSGPLRFQNMSQDEIQARITELLRKRETQAQ